MTDLFGEHEADSPPQKKQTNSYSAQDIEVLEGLEPVRKRPGMYIGGTDEKALHHLATEILDNSIDEVVAGHANQITVTLHADRSLSIMDNGRGIPVDAHPRFPDKSALEVILTTLHAGGKFGGGAYKISGGLHGVGASVVNALSSWLTVEVTRESKRHRQRYQRGKAETILETVGKAAAKEHGTIIHFMPDEMIFGTKAGFRPDKLFAMVQARAYLIAGVKLHWQCAPELLTSDSATPADKILHFPNGIRDYLDKLVPESDRLCDGDFSGQVDFPDDMGKIEWSVCWPDRSDAFLNSYCNTVRTPQGGTHEQGMRNALVRAIRSYASLTNQRKINNVTPDDVLEGIGGIISCFYPEPEFQGQTKEKLTSQPVTSLVEKAVKDRFEQWLSDNPTKASTILDGCVNRAEERLRRKQQRDVGRASATRRLRLPGKLADCSVQTAEGTELFLVEGDSAGGSAKQARDRRIQAVLPLRGKILNVANSTSQKMQANQELSDLLLAMGVQTGKSFCLDDLRYEKIVIMTDADVDGAHIAALLITFFVRELPELVKQGHLYLASPPLYRLSSGGQTLYARDDAHRDQLMETIFKGKKKVEIGRFKGLGEMMPKQLRETTMAIDSRLLYQLRYEDCRPAEVEDLINRLMGKQSEARYHYIIENAAFAVEAGLT